MNQYTSSDLARLGELLHADGPEAHLADLRRVAAAADALGLAPHAREVLLDADAPLVARQRAFSVVARDLDRGDATPVPALRPVDATPTPAAVAPLRPMHAGSHRPASRPGAAARPVIAG